MKEPNEQTVLDALTLQRVETKLDKALSLIGFEDEDERGERIGKGILGRLIRLEAKVEKKFARYDSLLKWGAGFVAACGMFIGSVWLLAKDKLGIK
jgi:hypothetical protein